MHDQKPPGEPDAFGVVQAAFLGAACAIACLASSAAHAQVNLVQGSGYDPYTDLITDTIARKELNRDFYLQKQRGATRVQDQSRQFAAPEGVRVGPFVATPFVKATTTYDDNVFRFNQNKKSDLRTVITPGISVNSDSARHKLDFSLSGRIVTYLENSDQNHEDYGAAVRGALHFDHAHTLAATLTSSLSHEERGGSTTPFDAAEPVPVFRHRASFGITRDVGRLYGTLSGRVERRDYQDVRARNGTRLDQDHRDTDSIGGRLHAGYRINPGFEVVGSVSAHRYENKGVGVQDFDGEHFDLRGGVGFEVSPLLNFELLAGYGLRTFDSNTKEDFSTAVFGGRVEWLPTRRVTVRGNVGRNISESPDANGGAFIDTFAGAELDYEVYHNVIATAGVRYTNSEFTATSREDDTVSAALGVKYLYSKNLHLGAGYEYVQRNSSDARFEADNNRFTVGAKLQF